MNNVNAVNRGRVVNTTNLVKIGMLSAISIVLMMFEISFPIFPSFLQMDISDLPALIGAVSMGPVAGVMIELIKNVLHLFKTSTAGVGEIANFVIGVTLVIPIGVFYKKEKSLKNFIIGSIVGTVLMVISACLFNYYILLPLYSAAMGVPMQSFADMANKITPIVTDIKTLIYFSFGPFNFIKSIIVCVLGYIVCNVLKPALK